MNNDNNNNNDILPASKFHQLHVLGMSQVIEVEVAEDGSTLEQSLTPCQLQEWPQHCWPFLNEFEQLDEHNKPVENRKEQGKKVSG